MSTNRTPDGRLSPAVYRRRRLVVLLGLIAVIVAIVLIIVRPGASSGEEQPKDAASASDSKDAPETSDPSAPPTVIPTEAVAVDGDACKPAQVTVEAVTDKTEYAAGENPNLSVTITNTGKNTCVLNAGSAAQVFTIKSGDEQYWTSTDCAVDPVDAEVALAPNTPVSSSVPIIWDRTRSAPDTCEGAREAVPAGGASYHLSVTVSGIESAETKQFLLY
ncbi:hypothetical protein ET445_06780 [Agromyces protaetiae]|uniref:DUF4232 domain-containing protein n=1 Tax=Agromyces protaetiae TaxID=2509455 RepID=A0A4P6FGU8_9MICO|nr:hypothetical protein [Agromyces protaetiae]QAY73097.1 hypothetical protein ET445_06780 [Agromyces protaetiae]